MVYGLADVIPRHHDGKSDLTIFKNRPNARDY
jgi:hypothetical protein